MWYEEIRKLTDFAEALTRSGIVEDMGEVTRRPYKYQEEYNAWEEAGFPDEGDETWDDFVAAITSSDEDESE